MTFLDDVFATYYQIFSASSLYLRLANLTVSSLDMSPFSHLQRAAPINSILTLALHVKTLASWSPAISFQPTHVFIYLYKQVFLFEDFLLLQISPHTRPLPESPQFPDPGLSLSITAASLNISNPPIDYSLLS